MGVSCATSVPVGDENSVFSPLSSLNVQLPEDTESESDYSCGPDLKCSEALDEEEEGCSDVNDTAAERKREGESTEHGSEVEWGDRRQTLKYLNENQWRIRLTPPRKREGSGDYERAKHSAVVGELRTQRLEALLGIAEVARREELSPAVLDLAIRCCDHLWFYQQNEIRRVRRSVGGQHKVKAFLAFAAIGSLKMAQKLEGSPDDMADDEMNDGKTVMTKHFEQALLQFYPYMDEFGYRHGLNRRPTVDYLRFVAELKLWENLNKAIKGGWGAGGPYSVPTVYTFLMQHIQQLPRLLDEEQEAPWVCKREGLKHAPAALLSWLPGVLHATELLRFRPSYISAAAVLLEMQERHQCSASDIERVANTHASTAEHGDSRATAAAARELLECVDTLTSLLARYRDNRKRRAEVARQAAEAAAAAPLTPQLSHPTAPAVCPSPLLELQVTPLTVVTTATKRKDPELTVSNGAREKENEFTFNLGHSKQKQPPAATGSKLFMSHLSRMYLPVANVAVPKKRRRMSVPLDHGFHRL